MKYKLLHFFLFLLVGTFSQGFAQYENVWAFGTKAGIDFNSGIPLPIQTNMGVFPGVNFTTFGEGSASVCDVNGQLLFYTEGFYVWDKNGNVMPNGKDLTPTFGLSIPYTPTGSTSQGVVIVPMPENNNKYYIFSLTAQEYWKESASHLYYSVVDMTLNGGLGDVIVNEKKILIDSFLAEKMTTTLGDRCNIWLLTCSITPDSSNFKAYEITPSGLNTTPVVSNTSLGSIFAPFGTMCVSPDRKKIIATQSGAWGGNQGAALFDFDGITGLISNPLQILPSAGGYGAAFSPDGSRVYVNNSSSGTVLQYDLTNDNPDSILASQINIGSLGFSHLKLAPDGKIYAIMNRNSLSVINFPDRKGVACEYRYDAVKLLTGQTMHGGLPNIVSVIPRVNSFTAEDPQGACWANINKMSLSAKDEEHGWDYMWNDGRSEKIRTVDMPGTYWITYHTPPCTYNVDTFHVSFPNGVLPSVYIESSCNSSNNGKAWAYTYADDTVTYHYIWTSDNDDTVSYSDTLKDIYSGDYILHVSTASCDTSFSVFIPNEEHRVFFQTDSILCQSTEMNFNNLSDSSFTNFYWNFGDGVHSVLRDPYHTYWNPGTYQVSLLGIGGICRDSLSKTIIVDSIFEGKFTIYPGSICMGESIVLYPDADHTTVNLNWDFGDGVTMTTDDEAEIQHAYNLYGTMRISLNTHFRACPNTLFSDSVYVEALPYIDLGSETGLCMNGAPIYLKNLYNESSEKYYYLWSTGDTTQSLKVTHPGTYSVTVKTDALGCSSTEFIEIKRDCYIDIPNAFTPNGDGINDYFFPRQLLSQNIEVFKMQVIDRWGKLVFETNRLTGKGWDGKFNGSDQPNGVYIYRIQVGVNGRIEQYNGNVTLIR